MSANKILMVLYNYFPEDVRPRRQADTLIKAGYTVDLICVGNTGQAKVEKNVFGVNVYRILMPKERSSKLKYMFQYFVFFLRSFFMVNKLYFRERYNIIHVHNMPDFLVFTALIPRLLGSKVVLDLHDPSPEIFNTKFDELNENILFKLLKWQEKISRRFADFIITTNKSFVDRFISRGCPSDKIRIVMNSPQESIFEKYMNIKEEKDTKRDNNFTLMYHGFIVERHGLDMLSRAVYKLKNKIPEIKLIVYGDGEFTDTFLKLINELELKDHIKFEGPVLLETIAEAISTIDVGVIPNRVNQFTEINFPVRIFEYICQRKPVIVPYTQGIRDYFGENSIFYFKPNNEDGLVEAIENIYYNRAAVNEVIENSYKVYQEYTWSKQGQVLLDIYRSVQA